MVSILESKSNSQCTYAPYKSEKQLLFNVYDMHQSTSLEIDYKLNVHKSNSETGCDGSVQIRSKSAIVIKKNGAINANECASNERAQCNVNSNCGGAISLISDSPIINYGDITSNGTNEECSGGSINIKCTVFKNFGRIESKNGRMKIVCHSFENDCDINPQPTVIIPWQYLILDAKQ
eukprot:267039_1